MKTSTVYKLFVYGDEGCNTMEFTNLRNLMQMKMDMEEAGIFCSWEISK